MLLSHLMHIVDGRLFASDLLLAHGARTSKCVKLITTCVTCEATRRMLHAALVVIVGILVVYEDGGGLRIVIIFLL